MASFLFSCGALSASHTLSLAKQQRLSSHATWLALLQFKDGKPLLDDAGFYLSSSRHSAEDELNAAISLLIEKADTTQICRFPARYLWLQRQLQQQPENLAALCPGFAEFQAYVPIEQISLIYANENISRPTTMMGHAFLKLSGHNAKGQLREHAISFYTELDSINPLWLGYETLLAGKAGYFVLSPYQERLEFYTQTEQRNIIEYHIALDADEVELVQAYLWELKQTRLDYFFHTYNCATLSQLILAIAKPALGEAHSPWISPVDVVKSVQVSGLVNNASLFPATKWRLKMLLDSLQLEEVDVGVTDSFALEINSTKPQSPLVQALSLDLQQTYQRWLLEQGHISSQQYEQRISQLPAQGVELSLSQYKDPAGRTDDSQFWLYYGNRQNWRFGFLPASHQLSDDNRQLFSESALALLSLEFEYRQSEQKLDLYALRYYGFSHYLPYDALTRDWSGHFALGTEFQAIGDNSFKRTHYLYGGIGRSYSVTEDVLVYATLDAGTAFSGWTPYVYGGAAVGMMVYEIGDQKSTVSLRHLDNYRQQDGWTSIFHWQQSWFVSSDWSIKLHWEHQKSRNWRNHESGIRIQHAF